MFYTEFEAIINAVRKGGLSGEKLIDTIISQIDSRKIYDSDDILSSDIYFTLMHYASGEEQITDAEWVYFLQCLKGERSYSLDDKNEKMAGRL